jgi:sugar/nucleoside kinase (ribokinase family)
MCDFTAIGHVAICKNLYPDGEWTFATGSIAYVALTAKKLGKTVKAITKVGEDISDEHEAQLRAIGIDVKGMIAIGAKTTRVDIDMREERRRGRWLDFCEEIKPEDVVGLSDTVSINPVMGEIPWETLISITGKVIAVDCGGFVRSQRYFKDGTILMRQWSDAGLFDRLRIYRSTEQELWHFAGKEDTLETLQEIVSKGTEIAIATQGSGGALLVMDDGRFRIPTFEISRVDRSGAGDSFLTGFLCEYLDGKEPLWCAAMGAAVSASLLETIGPTIGASLEEIRRRAGDVYDRVERL